MTLRQGVIFLYLGAIASGLCFFFWNRAAVKTSSGTLAVFNNAKIPLGVAVSILFFKEQADSVLVLISLFLIGGSLFFSERHSRKKGRIFAKKRAA